METNGNNPRMQWKPMLTCKEYRVNINKASIDRNFQSGSMLQFYEGTMENTFREGNGPQSNITPNGITAPKWKLIDVCNDCNSACNKSMKIK